MELKWSLRGRWMYCQLAYVLAYCQSDGTAKRWKKGAGSMTGFYLTDGAPCWFAGGWVGFSYINPGYVSSGSTINGYVCAAGTWVSGVVYVPPTDGGSGGI